MDNLKVDKTAFTPSSSKLLNSKPKELISLTLSSSRLNRGS